MRRTSYLIAILVIGFLLSKVSDKFTLGPSWIVPLISIVLLVPLSITVLKEHHNLTRVISMVIVVLVTIALITSVVYLIYALFHKTESALSLFQDALLLWVINVGVFSVWYWEVDQGGPFQRHLGTNESTDFVFPQMVSISPLWVKWKPGFIDYLFLAFNTSTAFSPTDTLVMSSRAKLLMMTQAMISLIIIAVLAAKAVNAA